MMLLESERQSPSLCNTGDDVHKTLDLHSVSAIYTNVFASPRTPIPRPRARANKIVCSIHADEFDSLASTYSHVLNLKSQPKSVVQNVSSLLQYNSRQQCAQIQDYNSSSRPLLDDDDLPPLPPTRCCPKSPKCPTRKCPTRVQASPVQTGHHNTDRTPTPRSFTVKGVSRTAHSQSFEILQSSDGNSCSGFDTGSPSAEPIYLRPRRRTIPLYDAPKLKCADCCTVYQGDLHLSCPQCEKAYPKLHNHTTNSRNTTNIIESKTITNTTRRPTLRNIAESVGIQARQAIPLLSSNLETKIRKANHELVLPMSRMEAELLLFKTGYAKGLCVCRKSRNHVAISLCVGESEIQHAILFDEHNQPLQTMSEQRLRGLLCDKTHTGALKTAITAIVVY
eukprot:m.20681 g.20681  ORF g.20681 m.20681 type:complete len:394 (-) comp13054_c0_seq1:147-1328(-)